MFEDEAPKHKVGFLSPLAAVDNGPYEFYRLAPPGFMAVIKPVGLAVFSKEDVQRVFAPLDAILEQLVERGIELTIQTGAPLAALLGVESHDHLLAHIEKQTARPATSTITSVVRACRAQGLKRIVLSNKWSAEINRSLGRFFARDGIEIVGVSANELAPADFIRIPADDHMRMCYALSRRAIEENPDCDGIYIGGGTWLSEPITRRLEEEFDTVAICNQTAQMWDILHILNEWRPITTSNRLMAFS